MTRTKRMRSSQTRRLSAVWLLSAGMIASAAVADEPKHGGILRIYHRDSPPSASLLEESTFSAIVPFMGIFNNLVLYRQDVPQNSLDTIVPELATRWAWSADGLALAFTLRDGVKWHDGKPFTAKDVKCTWDLLMEKSAQRLRKNPRKSWYGSVGEVTADGDLQATFHLKRPQPALLSLLASGFAPVYPCHVSPAEMRTHPIGTGPFKFVEFKPNESIKIARNPQYWRKDRPYLDGIEFAIVANRSTAILAFIAGRFDMTFPTEVTPTLLKDIRAQAPGAVCETKPMSVVTALLVNREAPPFDEPDLRRAMALTLDRKAFIDILYEGQATIGGAMQPAPEGVWGMPSEMLQTLPGYDPDVAKNRAEARGIMERLGYGPARRLKTKVAARNIPSYRDPATIFIDQLKEIYIDADLDLVETSNWFAKIARRDYAVGIENAGSAVDDPDQNFFENYACGAERNYTQYCNRDLERRFEEQSMMGDPDERKRLVWEIDRRLQEDMARPIVLHRRGATCWRPEVKGFTMMVNSSYNGYRFEDVWLDRQ